MSAPTLPAAFLASLTDTGFRLFGGRMAISTERFDNTTQKTWQVTCEVPAPSFKRVKVIIGNGDTAATRSIGGVSVAAPAAASDLNGALATHVKGQFAGSDTGTIAVASGATSFRRNYLLSDWITIASVARTDGGTRPLLLMRIYEATSSSTISILGNGAQDFTPWASRSDGNLWSMRFNDGNCCQGTGTPANFASTTNVSQCGILGFVFETANGEKICTIAGQGDSITEGQGTYVGEGFGLIATEALHAQYPSVNFSWANSGWSGSGTTSFQPRNSDMFAAGLVPDITIFPNGSPNTNPPIIAGTITTMTQNYDDCIYSASLYGVRHGGWTWLPTNPVIKDWNSSDSLRVAWDTTALSNTKTEVSDFNTALSGIIDGDGQVNMLAGSTSDNIHPNDTGNLILKPLAIALAKNIFANRFTYDPLAKRFFDSLVTPPDATRRVLYDTWYKAMRAAGLLTRMDVAYLMATFSTEAGAMNLINPGVNTLTLTGSPAFTIDSGYQGDGTTTKLDTGLKASATTKYQQDSAHISVYSGTVAQGAASTDLGNGSSVAVLRNGINQFLGRINAASNATIASVTDGSGMFQLSRTASNLTTFYRNASSIGTSATASGAVDAANNICFFGRGGSAAFSNRLGQYGSIGDGLSGADATAEYNATFAFLHAVGAA